MTFRAFWGFEPLCSSIGWRVMAFGQNVQVYLSWDFSFYQKNCFWAM